MRKKKTTPEDTKRAKDKIRKHYQSANPDRGRVIPAKEPEDFYKGHGEKRVAIYVRVSTGDIQQLIIKDLVESYKLAITPQKVPCGICAVSTLEHIHRQHGFHVLDRTLRLCVGAWEGDVDSLSASILRGVAHLVAVFGDLIKDDTFKEKVGSSSVRQIFRAAKERNAGTRGFAEAMLDVYNKRNNKNPLKFSKLHATKSTMPNVTEG